LTLSQANKNKGLFVTTDFEVEVSEEEKIEEPKRYRVLLLNDDYSTMDFVVHVLMTVFQKSEEEASRIMLQVHHNGKGLCGVYIYEIAQTKVMQVETMAQQAKFPLKAIIEEE
jgi:ATP-dependent Clp protease adaptor protein ClpS